MNNIPFLIHVSNFNIDFKFKYNARNNKNHNLFNIVIFIKLVENIFVFYQRIIQLHIDYRIQLYTSSYVDYVTRIVHLFTFFIFSSSYSELKPNRTKKLKKWQQLYRSLKSYHFINHL